jgi:hypothetical protein
MSEEQIRILLGPSQQLKKWKQTYFMLAIYSILQSQFGICIQLLWILLLFAYLVFWGWFALQDIPKVVVFYRDGLISWNDEGIQKFASIHPQSFWCSNFIYLHLICGPRAIATWLIFPDQIRKDGFASLYSWLCIFMDKAMLRGHRSKFPQALLATKLNSQD